MSVPNSRATFKEYCLRNKYSRWYFALVDRALDREWTKKTAPCYVEGHHIVPRSISGDMMGTGDIVQLTAREHFITHLLLPKMLLGKDKQKMQLALHRITTGNNKNYCKSSYLYEVVRKQHATAASRRSIQYWASLTKEQKSKMRSGEKNSRWGAVVTEETRRKISAANKGRFSKEKHPLWNVGHSEETKRRMSESRKGTGKGLANPNYGKVGAAAGKKWFHDPINKLEKYFIPGQQPAGFIQGRL